MGRTANGKPTKEFFVEMLTRDIELNDAILDLLDNCLDGVIRQKKGISKLLDNYYEGFYAHITISKDSFLIEDNCGGIPLSVAENYAFRMGRPADAKDNDLPTVGIYGIGMKRAIFKIGKSAKITTRTEQNSYQVDIPSSWSESDEWDFSIGELNKKKLLDTDGTRIEITDINQGINAQWNNKSDLDIFLDNLKRSIKHSYSFIIQKGFSIVINEDEVKPVQMELLFGKGIESTTIKPFLYTQRFDDVNVSLALGFYASPPSQEDIDDANELKRYSADAGWTIICNDRVVLYNDKSHLTGWGEGGVPRYHTQFIGISGVVIFESTNPKMLPMTTTKRGIDMSSEIYAQVRDKMREGLKLFTNYTNRWKGRNEEEREYSTYAERIPINQMIGSKEDIESNLGVSLRKNQGAFIFKPDLPRPAVDKPIRMIRFSKNEEDILLLIEYLYGDNTQEVSPSRVGEECFNKVLNEAKSSDKAGE